MCDSGSGPPASDWPAILKAITGHALCESCIAAEVGTSIARVHEVVGRMAVLIRLATHLCCERCQSAERVHAFMKGYPK